MNRHPTAWTIALVVIFTVVLSLLPLPDSLQPLAFRKDGVGPTLLATLMPQHGRQTLDEIRHAHLDEQTSASEPEALADLLAATPTEVAPKASDAATGDENARADKLDSESGPQPAAKAADADPNFWLRTNSAPPVAWLSAGAKSFADFRRIEALARRVGASHRDIEEGCRDPSSDTATNADAANATGTSGGARPTACHQRALDPFFDALAEIGAGERREAVRVVHIGNSLIASDYVASTIRRQLSDRYGSGGTGFLFVDRPTRISGSFDRVGKASAGWNISLLTDRGDRSRQGLGGARYTSKTNAREEVRFALRDNTSAEIAWLARADGGLIDIAIDGKRHGKPISTRGPADEASFTKIDLPKGARELTLSTREGSVELFGVTLENGRPGIVHDTYGLPGGTADVFLQADEAIFGAQLKRRDPAMVLIMLGGNESYEMSRGWMSAAKARKTAGDFIDRVRGNVPNAACVVTSPLDAGVRSASGTISPRPFGPEVRDMLREESLKRGCAFWDMHGAMGGVGSAGRWFEAKLMSEDLVHPRGKGAEILGHLFVAALERARLTRAATANDLRQDPPGIGAPERLERFFGKLDALDRKERQAPVNVAQIGASHTAAHFFTDAARTRLAKEFGGSGRGFVAAGASSKRLRQAGVERTPVGDWKVHDAREFPPGGIWGLTGIRAEGQPGARHVWRFGLDDKRSDKSPGSISLHFLDAPDLKGRLSVKIDGGAPMAIELGGVNEPTARVERWPVQGVSHVIEVTNESQSAVSLFGAALDLDRPGIRWDALGLPGATAILADGFDRRALKAQLATRQADLLVLFYGTNEADLIDLDAATLTAHYTSLLTTLRGAAPEAECLIIGPTDRLDPSKGPQALAPSMALSNATIRQVARDAGCAFWSSRRAMGGTRSMLRWQEATPPLGHRDGVHLTPKGYEILSTALTDALLDEWRAHQKRAQASATPTP